MGRLAQKATGVESTLLLQRAPELQAALKGGVDRHRFCRGHGAIGLHRGVIQFAVGRVAGAGVVHRSTALKRGRFQPLQHQQPQRRIQLMQQSRQGGSHDPGSHENGVVMRFRGGGAVLLHRTQGV